MIPRRYIEEWKEFAPWPDNSQVEQDLIIERALVEIFSDEMLNTNLAFRGGTAFHKLYLRPQARYSEDIDLVQTTETKIGPILDRLRKRIAFLESKPKIEQTKHNNTITYRFASEIEPVINMRLKIEINTREHFTVLGLKQMDFEVKNSWFNGQCKLNTYELEELFGTKLRALYQRRKSRDLFDIYWAYTNHTMDTKKLLACYKEYMQFVVDKLPSKKEFILNMEEKMQDKEFTGDIQMVLRPGIEYDNSKAYEFIKEELFENYKMADINHIPNSWKEVRVKDLSLAIHYGYTASSTKTNTGIKFLRITDIQEYKVNWDNVPFVEMDYRVIDKYLLKEGDLVFARTGATVGKSFLISGKTPDAVFASYLIRIIVSKNVSPAYLFYFFQSADYWKQIGIKSMGIGQPNVNASLLSQITLNLAPQNEQYRIVSKIEEIFTDLEQIDKSLNRAIKQIEALRYSLLKNAFEGKLTETWRNDNKLLSAKKLIERVATERERSFQEQLKKWENEKLQKKRNKKKKISNKPKSVLVVKPFSQIEIDGFEKIPKEWLWCKVNELANVVMGQSPKGSSYNDKGRGVPLINGPVEFGPTPFSSTVLSKWTTSPTKMCGPGDLILCVRGSTTGRQNIAGFPACIGRGVAAITPVVSNRQYLYHYFNFVRKRIFEMGTGTTFPNVSQEQLNNFPIPVCSDEEQYQIVQAIEYRFTIADNIEQIINKYLQNTEAFRYSILHKAFKGKLLLQDVEDETVNNLLKKIKEEKETYLVQQTLKKPINKKIKPMENTKTALEILKELKAPILAEELWKKSKHKDNIEEFYDELKKIENKIEVVEKGMKSIITLKK